MVCSVLSVEPPGVVCSVPCDVNVVGMEPPGVVCSVLSVTL